jgi:HEAT repeat protein
VATLERLMQIVDEGLDEDPTPVIEELAGDRSLIPAVRAALEGSCRLLVRDVLAELYAKLAGAEAFPLLIRLYAADEEQPDGLEDPLSRLVRADPAGCRAVIRPLLGDADPALRRVAVRALGWAYEPGDFDTLRTALADPDPAVRRMAFTAMPTWGQEPRVAEVAVGAFGDPDGWVRHHAVMQLAWSAPVEVVDDMIALVDDPAGQVRSAIGEAIGRLAAGSDRAPGAAAALRRLLGDPKSPVRRSAAAGVGHLGGPLEALRPLAGDPDCFVRGAVASALASQGGPEFDDVLEALAADENGEVRWRARRGK